MQNWCCYELQGKSSCRATFDHGASNNLSPWQRVLRMQMDSFQAAVNKSVGSSLARVFSALLYVSVFYGSCISLSPCIMTLLS
jgi:hypothetical protein